MEFFKVRITDKSEELRERLAERMVLGLLGTTECSDIDELLKLKTGLEPEQTSYRGEDPELRKFFR